MLDELSKVMRHRTPIMRHHNTVCICGALQYLGVTKPNDRAHDRRLKVERRLAPHRCQHDGMAQISVRLKSQLHRPATSRRMSACIGELLIEHRVGVPGGLSQRSELNISLLQISIYGGSICQVVSKRAVDLFQRHCGK